MTWVLLLPLAQANPTNACELPTCDPRSATTEVVQHETERSILGTPLQPCSRSPMTGFYRDGYCRTGPSDRGVHVVCATMTSEFLTYTAAQGNDLSTAAPRYGFPGLKPGDRWCLCAGRWAQARKAGVAPTILADQTSQAALQTIERTTLLESTESTQTTGK